MQAIQRNPRTFWRLFVGFVIAAAIGGCLFVSFVPYPQQATIREPDAGVTIPLDRFQYASADNNRSVATVSACFTRSTWFAVDVVVIQGGTSTAIGQQSIGRSSKSSRPSDPYLMWLDVTLALADADTSDGRTTLLRSRGNSRSFGSFGGHYQPFEVSTRKVLPGTINPGERRIVYVEGDQPFHAQSTMTVDDFARANSGQFLVVTLELVR